MSNNMMPVLDFLKAVDGLLTDVCAFFYTHYLKGNQEANNNLMLFFQNVGRRDNEQPYYVEPQTKPDDYRHIIEKQGQIVTQILDKLQKRNLDEHTFYTLLWEQICNDTLFPSDEEKIAVLVQLFNMPTLPYFQMEASHKMEDAEYSRWTDELLPKIQKAVYALNCGFEQKTQVTEQLLIIEKTITDDKAKQVFWSHIISFFERKIEQKTCRKKDINDEQKDG
jgi:hypothetical protein